MKNYHILFILTSVMIFSSCGFTYDVMAPRAEERRRNYVFNTYNYADFKKSSKGISDGKTYVTDLKSLLQTKHNASINTDGTLQGVEKHTENAENNFGPFQSYLEVDEVVSIAFSRKTSAMKGFKMRFPQTFTAKNHKPKTINVRKQIRIGAAIGDLYPWLGLGFFFEGGHLWKMKKSYDVVLEPTEAYKEYCEKLSYLAHLISNTDSCAQSQKNIKIQDAWIADVNYHAAFGKEYIGNFNPVKVSSLFPKKPTEEINQSHLDGVENCINKIENQDIFFVSSNLTKVYYDIVMAAEKKEMTEAVNKAIAESYDIFLQKEVLCDNDKQKLQQKDVWIVLAENKEYGPRNRMASIKDNNYQWILQKDDKIKFEVKNVGIVATKDVFVITYYNKAVGTPSGRDYASYNDLYCSKESAKAKIKQIKQEHNLEIAKRKKEREDAFQAWLNEKVQCADNNKTIKKRYTWVIIKKNDKRESYRVRDVKIDKYKSLLNRLYKENFSGDGVKTGYEYLDAQYSNRIYFSSKSKAEADIEIRERDSKRYQAEKQAIQKKKAEEERAARERKNKLEEKNDRLMVRIHGTKLKGLLSNFKNQLIEYPTNYTTNNCPNGRNCRLRRSAAGFIDEFKSKGVLDDSVDWLEDNGYDYLIDYWNDWNGPEDDIY